MVLYGADFVCRTDEQTFTHIWAVADERKEFVTFKYDGKRYKRKLRNGTGFLFKGWLFNITTTEF